jgi:hypothetical protein
MNKLKTFVCILGAVVFILLDLGLLFKIMHYPGSAPMLLLSLGMMPVFIVFVAILIMLKK